MRKEAVDRKQSYKRYALLATLLLVVVMGWRFVSIIRSDDCLEDFFDLGTILNREPSHFSSRPIVNGAQTVCHSSLRRFSLESGLEPLPKVIKRLDFVPLNLIHTPFEKMKLVGAKDETYFDKDSALYRVFRDINGRTVTIFEQDLAVSKITTRRRPEDELARVNGFPARLIILQTKSGEAVSVLDWQQGEKIYQIWLDLNVVQSKKKAQLFMLAESISKIG